MNLINYLLSITIDPLMKLSIFKKLYLLEDLKFIKSTLSTKIDNCKASNRPADMVAPTFNPKNGLKKLVQPSAKSVKVESFSNTSNNHYELSSFVESYLL